MIYSPILFFSIPSKRQPPLWIWFGWSYSCVLLLFMFIHIFLCGHVMYVFLDRYFLFLLFSISVIDSYCILLIFICFQWKKAEEKLERELREAEASESTEKKLKLVGSSVCWYAFKMLLNNFNNLLFWLVYI